MGIDFDFHDRVVVVHGERVFGYTASFGTQSKPSSAVFASIAVLGTAPAAALCGRYMRRRYAYIRVLETGRQGVLASLVSR